MGLRDVHITTQSFREAGGIDIFPRLGMEEIIYGMKILGSKKGGLRSARIQAEDSLKRNADEKGFYHVFKVDYESGVLSDERCWCFAWGTAYSGH